MSTKLLLNSLVPLAMIACISLIMSCSPSRISYPDMPPLSKVDTKGERIDPRSQRYKIAVLTFVDQTGKASLVTDAAADILTTELFHTQRFDIFDRADLTLDRPDFYEFENWSAMLAEEEAIYHKDKTSKKSRSKSKNNKKKKESKTRKYTRESGMVQKELDAFIPESKTRQQYRSVVNRVDGILLAYITAYEVDQKGNGYFEFDYRIVNGTVVAPWRYELRNLVVFSNHGKVRFTTDKSKSVLTLDRRDVKDISEDIKIGFTGRFGKLNLNDSIRVTSIEGRKLTINSGESDNMKRGFVGFIVLPTKFRTYDYLARFVIVQVFDRASVGYVLDGDDTLLNIEVGSIARIK